MLLKILKEVKGLLVDWSFPNLGGYEEDYSAMPVPHSSTWVPIKPMLSSHATRALSFVFFQLSTLLVPWTIRSSKWEIRWWQTIRRVHSKNHRLERGR